MVRPPGVINWERNTLVEGSLPDFVIDAGPAMLLSGELLFSYDVPFSLTSSLQTSGFNQINLDFLHTAALSLFDIPDGAALISGSGRSYPLSAASSVPLPGTLWLFGFALLALMGFARKGQFARVG